MIETYRANLLNKIIKASMQGQVVWLECGILVTNQAGTATISGTGGADWWEKNYKSLPDYYIDEDDLISLGWRIGKKPSRYAPNKMFTGGIFYNENGHLPSAPGRTWQEADINYVNGKRNTDRILLSSDGLLFVTYDHYETFYEIV